MLLVLLLLRNNYVDRNLVLSRTLKEIFTDIVPFSMGSYTPCYYVLNSMLFFSLSVKSLGCFKDTGRRAIPQMDGRNPLVKGFYRKRADAIVRCGLVAMRFGYRVFAVQHQGWCATGPRAHLTYRKYGPSNRCRNGKGGPWANDVYAVYGKFKSGFSPSYFCGYVRALAIAGVQSRDKTATLVHKTMANYGSCFA